MIPVIAYAETFRDAYKLQYDKESIIQLDKMFDSSNPVPAKFLQIFVSGVGSFLGQCMVQNLKGKWVEEGGTWLVNVAIGNINPLWKAQKKLKGIPGESLMGLYECIENAISNPEEWENFMKSVDKEFGLVISEKSAVYLMSVADLF
jgi:hypothetical protein